MNEQSRTIMQHAEQVLNEFNLHKRELLKIAVVILFSLLLFIIVDLFLVSLLYAAAYILWAQIGIILWMLLFNGAYGFLFVHGSLQLCRQVFYEHRHLSLMGMFRCFVRCNSKQLRHSVKPFLINIYLPALFIVLLILTVSYNFNWHALHYGFVGLSGLFPNLIYTLSSIFNRAVTANFAPFTVLLVYTLGTALLLLILGVLGYGTTDMAQKTYRRKTSKNAVYNAFLIALPPALTVFTALNLMTGLFLMAQTVWFWLLSAVLQLAALAIGFLTIVALALCWVFASTQVVYVVMAQPQQTAALSDKRSSRHQKTRPFKI